MEKAEALWRRRVAEKEEAARRELARKVVQQRFARYRPRGPPLPPF